MTQSIFQATVARLVIDPDFRDEVRINETATLDRDLTALERQRVAAIAASRGLDAARMLHKSFRLTKLYTMLPLTRVLLGPARLSREVGLFWKECLPVSHHFVDEAIAFCDFLQSRRSDLRVKHLEEIVAYERARLELTRPLPSGTVAQSQRVAFRHDPAALFAQLMTGGRPRNVPLSPCVLIGSIDRNGEIEWRLTDG